MMIIFNTEEISLLSRDNLIIYVGTHGCETALYADIVSGLPALPEYKAINITYHGNIIKTNICYISPLSDLNDISNYSLLNYKTIYSKPLINLIEDKLILPKKQLIYDSFYRNNVTNFSRILVLLDYLKKLKEYNWLI